MKTKNWRVLSFSLERYCEGQNQLFRITQVSNNKAYKKLGLFESTSLELTTPSLVFTYRDGVPPVTPCLDYPIATRKASTTYGQA